MSIAVSILCPNFNDTQYLLEKLSHDIPLLPDDWEYVICDDGSEEDQRVALRNFAAYHPNCILYFNEVNIGIAKTFNRLINYARGKYIICSSSNDIFLEEFFISLPKIARESSSGIITTDPGLCSYDFDRSGGGIRKEQSLFSTCKTTIKFPAEKTPYLFRQTNFWIAGHCSLLRRDLVLKYNGYNEELKLYCDWFLNHIIALDGGIHYVPKVVALWRQEEKSYSNSFSTEQLKELSRKILYEAEHLPKNIKKRAIKSTIFSSFLKRVFPRILFFPKYWRYLFFILVKKYYFLFTNKKTTFWLSYQ